ncbi:PAAR domain-containing protein [Polyangium jinanense]|uniref:PAAR domain-containing protein n=1 Tax=Polyangium jinanense TaxID=2829994 RepID=A0A9X3X8J0_9BACT|nr:PAAR domain-containing protein [Polyangium jinanense]MDC3984510.1 PAAR domain-containing protein [Polyangium jinanense]
MKPANLTFGQPVAKKGDQVVGVDTHIVMTPTPGGPVPTPTPMPFSGALDGNLSGNVFIENKPAATKGSTATNAPAHVPAGGPFQKPPGNKGTVQVGSSRVRINNKPAATNASAVMTCNDPVDAPNGNVISAGTVLVGE